MPCPKRDHTSSLKALCVCCRRKPGDDYSQSKKNGSLQLSSLFLVSASEVISTLSLSAAPVETFWLCSSKISKLTWELLALFWLTGEGFCPGRLSLQGKPSTQIQGKSVPAGSVTLPGWMELSSLPGTKNTQGLLALHQTLPLSRRSSRAVKIATLKLDQESLTAATSLRRELTWPTWITPTLPTLSLL